MPEDRRWSVGAAAVALQTPSVRHPPSPQVLKGDRPGMSVSARVCGLTSVLHRYADRLGICPIDGQCGTAAAVAASRKSGAVALAEALSAVVVSTR